MSVDARSRARIRLAGCGLAVVGLAAALSISGASAAPAAKGQGRSGSVREAQVFAIDRTGVASPVGLAYSSSANAFYVVGARPGALPDTDVAKLTPFSSSSSSDRSGTSRIAAAMGDPINMAFDARRNRLLFLGHARALFEVRAGPGGDLDRPSLSGRDATRFGLRDPQGIAVDPASGTLFVLDAAQPRILRIEPGSDGGFDAATTSEIDLGSAGLKTVRGLAFDPATGNLILGSGRTLVELATNGAVIATRDLSALALSKPEGLVFAPSGDRTDASAQLSLYVADSGTAPTGSTVAASGAGRPAPSEGQIIELSLAPQIAAAATTFTSQLVRTLDMGALSPPSPDPSGITYIPSTDRLLVSDGEVEETVGGVTHFQGANVWELNRNGLTLARTANVSKRAPIMVSMTDEPAGAGFNSANGHYLFAEDGGKRIYDLNPGADGLITAGDTFTYFVVNGFGNTDPEGVTFNPVNGRVYVADGVNREVYEYTPAGALLGHFDTAQYGVDDPEAVEANPQTGTLYVLSNRQSGPIIVETTTGGALLQTIDVSAATGAQKPAGLAYANASNGSGVKRFYWVDRGIDNDNNKFAVDGKLYEMTAPGGGPPPVNNPPAITSNGGGANANVSVAENQTAITTVTATDPDGNPITYSVSGGNDASRFAIDAASGVLTFVTAPDFENPTDVGGNNVYDVTVRASDGSLFDEQAIAVTVSDVGENPPVITSNGGGDTAAVSVVENQTAATDVDATDPDSGDTVTYSISGGADQAKFSIVPTTGVLTFVSAPNFEAPTDAGGDNVYDVVVRASDGSLFDSQAIAVTVTNVVEAPEPPVIAGGDTAAVSASENQTAVTDVDATDANGDTITYAKAGGADEAMFAIDSSTGVLTFVSAPDFEAPADAGGNNVYDVVVSASDGFLSDTQAIAVTVTDASEGSPLYFSLLDPATVGGVAAENEDVVFFNGSAFSLAFDGSDVGLTSLRIDAFSWVDANRVLLSFDVPGAVPGVAGTTDDSDIVLFTATSLGSATSGTFSMYFDGSDVGLTTTQEDVDAVELLPNGRILISTVNTVSVTGVTAEDEDLLEFVPTQLGPVTSGSFSMYFDGGDVGLTAAGEDVDAVAVDAVGKIHLSTFNNFSVTGVSGADEDVFVFTPNTLGTSTTGTYSSSLYFDGSVHGLAANDVFAIDLP